MRLPAAVAAKRRLAAATLAVAALAALPAAAAVTPTECAPVDTPGSLMPWPDTRGLRIGIALGSGSRHGLAHVGVLKELEARGVPVEIVAGTSVGAIVGGLWARGYSADEIASLSRGSDWEEAGEFAPSFQGLYSSRGLQVQMKKLLGDPPMEAWPKRFGAVATELATGERRLLSRGDGALAIQASSAVPVMFSPVMVGGQSLADGALVEPVPIQAARDLGADFVIAIDVAYRPYEEPAKGLVQFGFQAMHVLVNSLAEAQAGGADFRLRMDLHQGYMKCGAGAMIGLGRGGMRAVWPELVNAVARARASRKSSP